MTKLDTLSRVVLSSKQIIHNNWEQVLGVYKRQIFMALHDNNEIVRCFAKEPPQYPSTSPRPTLDIAKEPYNKPPIVLVPHLSTPLHICAGKSTDGDFGWRQRFYDPR